MTAPVFDRDLQQALVAQMLKESEARMAHMAGQRANDERIAEYAKASAIAQDRVARALEDLRKDLLSGLLNRG